MRPVESNPKTALSHWPADQSEPVLEQTIGDALRSAAVTWGERTALIEGCLDADQRRRWSFASLLEGSEQVARALLGRFATGEHVAVWAANCPEWVLIEFGAALAGITLVAVNPAYLAKELAYVLTQSKAVGLLVQSEYRGRNLLSVVEEVRPGLPHLRGGCSKGTLNFSYFVKNGLAEFVKSSPWLRIAYALPDQRCH
jgi:fatty-acyl-CoA synthase